MRIQLAALLALMGVSMAISNRNGNNRMQKLVQGLSQSQVGQTVAFTPSCTSTFNRFKKAVDWKSIISSSTTSWSDPDFPSDATALYWNSYTTNEMTRSTLSWKRLKDAYPNAPYRGTNVGEAVAQGYVGDCYYLAGIAALAELPERLDYNLITKTKNAAGLISLNVWVRGIQTQLVIDDSIPFYGSEPAFADIGTDQSLWGPIFEKAWAKINGNYEITNGGFPSEASTFLTGVPSASYQVKGVLSATALWNIVSPADDKNYIMSVWTDSGSDTTTCDYNLPCGHAYTLIKKIEATLADGSKVKLYQIRNPWRKETQGDGTKPFSGSYKDTATVWTTDAGLVKQTGFVSKNDGIVWMTESEFLQAFVYMQISEWRGSNWVQSVYSAEGATTASQTYYIDVPVSTQAYIKLDLYNPRMYAPKCRTDADFSKGKMQLYSPSGALLTTATTWDYWTSGYIQYTDSTPLAAGKYKVVVTPTWSTSANEQKDYTLSVYGSGKVTITNDKGVTSIKGSHELNYGGSTTPTTAPTVAPTTVAPTKAPVTTPAPATTKPSPVTTKPAPVTTKPQPTTTKPAPVTTKPAPVTTKPAPVTTKPAPVTTKPAPVTTKPAPATTKPAPVTTKPAFTTKPISTATPAPVTTKSAVTTAAPTTKAPLTTRSSIVKLTGDVVKDVTAARYSSDLFYLDGGFYYAANKTEYLSSTVVENVLYFGTTNTAYAFNMTIGAYAVQPTYAFTQGADKCKSQLLSDEYGYYYYITCNCILNVTAPQTFQECGLAVKDSQGWVAPFYSSNSIVFK